MAAPYLVKIASTTLTSTTATITFSSIPSTYAHLWLLGSLRSDRTSVASSVGIYVNSDSTASNYRYAWYRYYTASGSHPNGEAGNNYEAGTLAAGNTTANVYSTIEMFMVNYANNAKTFYGTKTGFADTSTNSNSRLYICGNSHESSAIVSSINLVDMAGFNFVAGSSVSLYGIKDS